MDKNVGQGKKENKIEVKGLENERKQAEKYKVRCRLLVVAIKCSW